MARTSGPPSFTAFPQDHSSRFPLFLSLPTAQADTGNIGPFVPDLKPP